MKKRNTRQKELILGAVRKLANHPSADDVFREVIREHPSISRATVYRNLRSLAEDGMIRRLEVPGEACRYDHCCGLHYHFRCLRCGRLFDLDMVPAERPEERFPAQGGFEFLGCDIIFKGICPECKGGKNEHDCDL